MRFIITLITSLILLLPASGQGEWERVEVEIDYVPARVDWFHDVQFIDRDIGFFIATAIILTHARYWIVYKTEDGGQTWNRIFDPKDTRISSIHFINESKGFLTDGRDEMLTSSDGGYSWTKDTSLSGVNDIFFLNDSIGWATNHSGNSGNIYKTKNGGESWNEVLTYEGESYYNSLHFIDEESGWVVGESGLIIKYNSNDGWDTIPAMTDLPLNKVFFVDRDIGWISGGYSNNSETCPIFLRTVDGGENWTQITETNYLINDFYFENKDHGWAVGFGVILETFNGGLNWTVVKNFNKRLNALHFKDGYGWVVGDGGLILKYDPTITGIKGDNRISSGDESLFQNYPNPFQSTTIISYQVTATSVVELNVYDISGRKVATLVSETQLTDKYEVEWDAEGMNSSIYFCELKTHQGRHVTKMVLID